VANPVRPTHVNRLVYRRRPVCLAGVNGHRDVVVADELERTEVMFGRMIVLGAGQVECHHASVLVGHCKLRHFERRFGRDVADAAENDVGNDAVVFLRVPEPRQHGFDDGREPEAALGMQHG